MSTDIVPSFLSRIPSLKSFQIVKELEDGFGTSTEYQDVIKELKTCCIDQEGDLYYIKKLQNDVTVLKGKLHFELK